jgi:hypothetical protein
VSGVEDHLDDFDYEERPEGSEWCDRCQGLGMADCRCGGDQCYCQNYGEMECPTCHGEGWWVPTPAQLAARAEHAKWLKEWWSRPSEESSGEGDHE